MSLNWEKDAFGDDWIETPRFLAVVWGDEGKGWQIVDLSGDYKLNGSESTRRDAKRVAKAELKRLLGV